MPDKAHDWGVPTTVLWAPGDAQLTLADFIQNPNGYERDDWGALKDAARALADQHLGKQPERRGRVPWMRAGHALMSPTEVDQLLRARLWET